MKRNLRYLSVGLICLALLLTSCRRFRGVEPTVRPTLTPTPRSTPLPPLPTPLPLGSEENPLHMTIVTPATDRSQRALDDAVSQMESALLQETGLRVDVALVSTDAEGLAALCGSVNGEVTAAWLSGLAYAAAYAQGCGSAALEVERGTRADAQAGDSARIVVNSAAEIEGIADLPGKTFCRLGYSDVYSWIVPQLMMRAGGLASMTDLRSIRDYEDTESMIADLADGICDAAGVAGGVFDDTVTSRQRSRVRMLDESVMVPYLVLVYPTMLPLAEQQKVSDALIAIGNGTRAATLSPMLDQSRLVPVSDDDLGGLRTFISRAGIDLAQAGG